MSFFGLGNNTMEGTDKEVGELALSFYFNEMKKLYPSFNYSYDQLLAMIEGKSRHFLSGLGFGIKSAEISEGRVKDAMRNLAEVCEGVVPLHNLNSFQTSLSRRMSKIDLKAIVEVAGETLEDSSKIVATGLSGFAIFKIATVVIGLMAVLK